MKDNGKYNYNLYGREYDIWFAKGAYAENGSLALRMLYSTDGYIEPLGYATVNIRSSAADTVHQYVDTNNFPEIDLWFEQNGIAKHISGMDMRSGFCVYPMMEFDRDWLNDIQLI